MSAAEDIHEGEIVPDAPTDIVPMERTAIVRAHVIAGHQPQEIVANAAAVATVLGELIAKQNLSKRLGGTKDHVEVGGWQAAGAMLGALGGEALHAETVWTRPVTDSGGQTGYEARVEVMTASRVVVGAAEAMCSRSERTWKTRDDYALRSMAETRAESRAYRRAIGWVINLAGYDATPAEEMGHDATAGPPNGPVADEALTAIARRALATLLPAEHVAAKCMENIVAGSGGYLPAALAGALGEIAEAFPFARPEPVAAGGLIQDDFGDDR